MEDNKILQITPDVKWIGVLDYDIRTFDIVMETEYGTTYNSYFINAEKKTIVETTKEKFWDIYEAKLQKLCDPLDIEYIIVNHTEPDHSGNIIRLLQIAPNAKVVGSGNAIRYMTDLMNKEFPYIIVKDGDTLDLGNKKLRFIGAPNLHWPDSMYSYLEEDKVLFTCDSFGSHFCHNEMYEDKVGNFDIAFKYYFDVILRPFSKFMLKAIEKIRPLDIGAVCPGHGPLLTTDWKKYVDLTEKLSCEYLEFPEKNRVLIAYVAAYEKTAAIANALAEGINDEGGVIVDLCDIEKMSADELGEKLIKASGILVGSPTINQNILLPVYTLFALCTPLRDKGKLAGSFGSYGWSGEASKIIENLFNTLKFDYVQGDNFVKFTPSENDIHRIRQWGKEFAIKLKQKE